MTRRADGPHRGKAHNPEPLLVTLQGGVSFKVLGHKSVKRTVEGFVVDLVEPMDAVPEVDRERVRAELRKALAQETGRSVRLPESVIEWR